jgi:hypothetical protein
VALGLTNLLIRRVVNKGYVRVARMGTRHVRYLMTPAGWEALARTTRLSMANTVHLYSQTREQIRASLTALSDRCVPDAQGEKRVVFYGAGDVAEIAYVSLQRTDLTLVGVVDDRKRGKFFDVEICDPERLTPEALNGSDIFPRHHRQRAATRNGRDQGAHLRTWHSTGSGVISVR